MVTTLTAEQLDRALEAMKTYINAPRQEGGLTPLEASRQLDRRRVEMIERDLRPLLERYLRGEAELNGFKTQIDGINKRNEFWGFQGPKGQMFFNMILKFAQDVRECDRETKTAIILPPDDETATIRIQAFTNYVKRIGQQHLETGGTAREKPKPGSAPFFLSYFWQIQDHVTWPIYYTKSISVMNDLGLWRSSDDPSLDYVRFKDLQKQLAESFTTASGLEFDLYGVEHVFWFFHGPTHRVRRTDKEVSVTVPDDRGDESTASAIPQAEVRDSIRIQALLAETGARMGMRVWLPPADRSAVLKEWNGDHAALIDTLPLNYDDTTLKTIERIDVLWLKGRSIRRAFEVEHTTSIYPGILRMADLLALQPNMDIKLHIVAPANRRGKVFQEIRRPVFSLLERGPLSECCTYLSYESVRELAGQPYLSHLSDSVLDEYEIETDE